MTTWHYDNDVKEHRLHFRDQHYMVAWKTPGGDYAVTCRAVDDPCGGDVEYTSTLAKAKKLAEELAASGGWLDLTL